MFKSGPFNDALDFNKHPVQTWFLHGGDPIDTKTGAITETQIGPEYLLPADIGEQDALQITALFGHTGSTNSKQFIARIGTPGSAITGKAVFSSVTTTATAVNHTLKFALHNMGKKNKQRVGTSWAGGNAHATLAVDFSTPKAMCCSCVLAGAGETATLDSVLIQIIRGGE